MPRPLAEQPDSCVSCGEQLLGTWCHACGEKRRDPRDLTLRAFAGYAVEAVTNADAKLWVTLRRLVRRPGALTRDFMEGRRRPFVAPLQLFLLANLVFFVLLQVGIGMDTFTTDLLYHTGQPIYGGIAEGMLANRVGELPPREALTVSEWRALWSEEQQEFRRRFNQATPRYANSLVILIVPLFALGIRLLRVRGAFLRDLVFGFHLFALLLLYSAALAAAFRGLYLVAPRAMVSVMGELVVTVLILGPAAVWLAAGFRAAYGDRWPAAVARGLAALMVLFLALTLYRGALFFVVFWMI
jgi:hypothetical protein